MFFVNEILHLKLHRVTALISCCDRLQSWLHTRVLTLLNEMCSSARCLSCPQTAFLSAGETSLQSITGPLRSSESDADTDARLSIVSCFVFIDHYKMVTNVMASHY